MAIGPSDNLERRAVHVVDGLVANPTDERLAYGVQRLVVIAGTKPADDVLRIRLRALARRGLPLPEHLQWSLDALDRLRPR
jgi:hypothetical protein